MVSYWRFLFLLLLSVLSTGQAFATSPQDSVTALAARRLDAMNAFRMARYVFDPRYSHTVLPAAFRKSDLTRLQASGQQIVRIDLVYTAYRLKRDFDQRQLNLDRLRSLEALLPGILANQAINWNLMQQTGCTEATTCTGFLHGFVLYSEPRHTKAEAVAEVDSIETRLHRLDARLIRSGMLVQAPVACYYPVLRYSPEQMSRKFRASFRCPQKRKTTVAFRMKLGLQGQLLDIELTDSTGVCAAALRWALRQSLRWTQGFRVNHHAFPCTAVGTVRLPLRSGSVAVTGYVVADSLIKRYQIDLGATDCVASRYKVLPAQFSDEGLIGEVMRRNKTWSKQLIVADVTSSMYPYTVDLLTWLRLSVLEGEKNFVFFSDGDDKPDDRKRIGSTGGIYTVRSADFDEVKATLLQAMRSGIGGGDIPENNIEAIATGLKQVPKAPEVILIADNHAFPRDTRLLSKLQGLNLKIILCGATPAINTQYLDLARAYGFSLHTVESDLTNLRRLHEGERVVIDRITYLVTKNGFRVVSDL